jgi:DNA-binding Lrp family transcriptional regulator
MINAFILVSVPAKESVDLIRDLKKSPAVVELAGVYGDADVVVKVQAADMRELDKLLFHTIQANRHVKLTRTYVVIEDQHWKR